MDHSLPDHPLLFEAAWEVCSQVGGIYTVLRSKAPSSVRAWGDDYFLIGPYREASARIELEPAPIAGPVAEAVAEMQARGYAIHTGRWLITGRPQVLLADLGPAYARLADAKYRLWRDNGIASPAEDWEFNEVVAFGEIVTDLLQLVQARIGERRMIALFHEWQGGAAIPRLRHQQARFATIFLTHATLVGRNLSSCNVNLYDNLQALDAGGVAARHGFGHRHAIEGAAAVAADVFATVSGITAMEAERFLGRRADLLCPNGLNVQRSAAPHEFQELHIRTKERIHDFVTGHFFPSYTFDLSRTLYIFTAGRYEYRNKGIDVFIEALHDLNQRMRHDNSDTTVVAFIITRSAYRGQNVETLNRQAMWHDLRDACDLIEQQMGRRLLGAVSGGRLPGYDDLLDETAQTRLKRMLHSWKRSGLPPIVTHDLHDDGGDAILQHLRGRRLFNHREDRVKVIFHPEFMTSGSPLVGLDYDDFVRGCNLGVFPSYYEPWGYTPLECLVRGIPCITSDLAGFGHYVMEHLPGHDEQGIFVARRRSMAFDITVAQVAQWLQQFTRMSLRERIQLRNRVESHAEEFDWANLSKYYREAERLALARKYPPLTVATGPDAAPGEGAPSLPVDAAVPLPATPAPPEPAMGAATSRTARQRGRVAKAGKIEHAE